MWTKLCSLSCELTDITAIRSDVEQLSDMRRGIQTLLDNQQSLLELLQSNLTAMNRIGEFYSTLFSGDRRLGPILNVIHSHHWCSVAEYFTFSDHTSQHSRSSFIFRICNFYICELWTLYLLTNVWINRHYSHQERCSPVEWYVKRHTDVARQSTTISLTAWESNKYESFFLARQNTNAQYWQQIYARLSVF